MFPLWNVKQKNTLIKMPVIGKRHNEMEKMPH